MGWERPPTQIGRALQELGIVWIGAHSPQAKGRVGRNFGTAQDRVVKGMPVAGVTTLEQANRYLEKKCLPWWSRTLTVALACAEDAHRPLGERVNLGVLSHVETCQVDNGYTLRLNGQRYRIMGPPIPTGLCQGRGAGRVATRRFDCGAVSGTLPDNRTVRGGAPAGPRPDPTQCPSKRVAAGELIGTRSSI